MWASGGKARAGDGHRKPYTRCVDDHDRLGSGPFMKTLSLLLERRVITMGGQP